ncbi:glycerate kinase family protein [Alicyclobacillus suci]|uniref:glycerate kinase family protein n=1 Tax=Alicyclobacillus suci TaxID=2816080 RepID=UPI001A8D8AAC|nr:glycerate kinase [Alicyclobacillus suci]
MKVVIAPDSFKGSLSAQAVAGAMAEGVRKVSPCAAVELVPIADGGEGTVDCLLAAIGGEKVEVQVHDPLGRPVLAHYGILKHGTVVLEVAVAAGLGLISDGERDVLHANTAGVGELIAHALDAGRTSFVIGLGGSATNDAGIGMLHALGARFYDVEGRELPPTPEACLRLAHIDTKGMHPKLNDATIRVACDVSNPLCGPLGATAVYGPQKGVTPDLLPILDKALEQFAMVVQRDLDFPILDFPGSGAAGGLGGAFGGVMKAELVQGIDLILQECAFDTTLVDADFVLTGEGKTDSQTVHGKAVQGVAMRAKLQGIPVFCVSGAVAEGTNELYECGVTALFSITPGPVSLVESMNSTYEYLVRSVENITRVYLAGRH